MGWFTNTTFCLNCNNYISNCKCFKIENRPFIKEIDNEIEDKIEKVINECIDKTGLSREEVIRYMEYYFKIKKPKC